MEKNKFPLEKCKYCHFLGHYEGYDLYFHNGYGETTLITRYGENEKYHSGLSFALRESTIKPLKEAMIRALMIPEYRGAIIEYVEKYDRVEFPSRWNSLQTLLEEAVDRCMEIVEKESELEKALSELDGFSTGKKE